MPTPAPSVDENASPLYGIRTPKANARAYLLGTLLGHTAVDIETVLQEFGIPPVLQGNYFVANSQAQRDAYFGTPASASARRLLQDTGAEVYRTDLGYTQRYYANKTDGGSNPGGRRVAGWYSDGIFEPGGATLSGVTIGNGTLTTRKRRIGNSMHHQGRLKFGSTTNNTNTGTNSIHVTVPDAALAGYSDTTAVGTAHVQGTVLHFLGEVRSFSSTQFRLIGGAIFNLGESVREQPLVNSFVQGTGVIVSWDFTYELAATE